MAIFLGNLGKAIPTAKDFITGLDKETGLAVNFVYEDLENTVIQATIIAVEDDLGGASYTDVTWEELIAIGNREAGQLYNISGSLNASNDYGKITLLSSSTFYYQNTPLDQQLITIL